MAVTVNGGAPSAPQIADFQTTFQVAPSSHVSSGGTAHANAVAAGAAGFMTGADKTKLDGVATGATANSSDATLLNRANHTGTQALTTLATQAANTVVANATTGAASPTAVAIAASELFGRGSTGNIAPITVGSGLTMTGTTLSATGGGTGTVTSVGMSVPTGLSVSGSPVTTTGTLAVTLTAGYVIPTQATLDTFLTEDLASDITTAKTSLAGADKFIILDSAASDAAKTLTASVLRTTPVGTSLGTTGTVDLDFAALVGTLQTITASGNITFTASNYAAGLAFELRIGAGGSTRTLAWPATWVAYGAALPTSLASGKVLTVAVRSTGTTEGAVDATSALSI